MKICLFGGTFDPPHLGHLIIAQTVCEAESFDKIVFMPSLNPPHKTEHNITPIAQRMEMLESVVKDNPRFEISDLEIERGGTSYSIDTILEFKKKHKTEKLSCPPLPRNLISRKQRNEILSAPPILPAAPGQRLPPASIHNHANT